MLDEEDEVDHRRSDQRYERRLDVDLGYEGRVIATRSRNISLGGLYVEIDQSLPFGARVHLTFHVPTQKEAVEVDGQVRWVEMDDGQVKGVGIRFEGLRARDVWALNKFFEQPAGK